MGLGISGSVCLCVYRHYRDPPPARVIVVEPLPVLVPAVPVIAVQPRAFVVA